MSIDLWIFFTPIEMPHTRSTEAKNKKSCQRRTEKLLKILQTNVPSLCKRFHAEYSKYPHMTNICIYTQTKWNGSVAQYRMSDAGRMVHYPRLEGILPSKYGIYCIIFFSGLVSYTCGFPLNVLNENGIHFDKEQIEVHNKSPEKIREILYEWVQDTIRAELCRRLSERIKEELVAAVWRPDRVARRLEEGGWEAIEALG